MEMDISIVCRSCMKEVASWEKENFDQRSIDMFCFCTNILISDTDKLPRQFCYDCFIKIESSYTFIKEAQRVNMTLRNILSRNWTSIIVQPDHHHKPYNTDGNMSSCTFRDNSHIKLEDTQDNHYEVDNVKEEDRNEEDKDNISTQIEEEIKSLSFKETTVEIQNNSNVQHNPRKIYNVSLVQAHLRPGKKKRENRKEDDPPADQNNTNKREHTNKHKSKSNVCPICGKSFKFKAGLKRHVSIEHSESKYTCECCPESFSKLSEKSEHLLSHSAASPFVCDICKTRFKLRKQLTRHIRIHDNVRPYCCQKCDLRFKQKSALKSHMMCHEKIKPHLCSICGMSFGQSCNLEAHMRTHSGEKPFRCAECPFASATTSSLARHRLRHTETKRHVCRHCRRGFYDASGLARHMRSHTGEQPFKCPYCTRGFVDSWKRKCHLMRAHKFLLKDIPRMPRDPGSVVDGDDDEDT